MVRQLLIYFCLHHRQRIRRHQLLQDLWPQNDAASALNAYRTTLSRLSEVLEPHLRLRTPMRYLEIGRDGETICFDPTGTLVILDSEKFASAVAQRDELQLDVLLQTLSAWQPPIPALRSAAWAIEFVETLNERYAAGCLFAAQHLLQVGDNDNATAWAERVINTTPWNEMGWQAYITATARQGQRTQALKLYGRAVAVLNDELAVAPSPQTVALGERLRSGEAI
jgi:DNA-binding SARP family transcriptional activator